MNKTNTSTWERIKDEHTTCLCYSERKGLYITEMDIASDEDVLFTPHGHEGYWEQERTIKKENLKIKISTNFGYGNSSYMRAWVEKDGEPLLDFDKSKIYILRNCSVITQDVMPYAWEKLFNKIILASRNHNVEECTTSAISYVEEISNLLDEKEFLIKSSLVRDAFTEKYNGIDVLIHVMNKTKDLIAGCKAADIIDEYFLDMIIDLCCNLLLKIQKRKVCELSDLKKRKLSDALFSIHEFMIDNGLGFDFFKFFVNSKG